MPYADQSPEARKDRYEKKKLRDLEKAATLERLQAFARGKQRRHLKPQVPHLIELLESLMKAWGGVTRLTQKIRAEFDSAKPGSQQRAKALELTVKLIELSTRLGVVGEPMQAASMTDDELQESAAGLLGLDLADLAGDEDEEEVEGDADVAE